MAFARLYISKFSRGRMPPDSPYGTRLGRESGKLTSAPPQKNFVARTPMNIAISDFNDVDFKIIPISSMACFKVFYIEGKW